MSDEQIKPIDYGRALRLLVFTAPDNIDPDGINTVLAEMNADGRASEGVIAVCTIAHIRDPAMRTEQGLDALRTVVATMTLRQEHDD
jgi:hypothetical protein